MCCHCTCSAGISKFGHCHVLLWLLSFFKDWHSVVKDKWQKLKDSTSRSWSKIHSFSSSYYFLTCFRLILQMQIIYLSISISIYESWPFHSCGILHIIFRNMYGDINKCWSMFLKEQSLADFLQCINIDKETCSS